MAQTQKQKQKTILMGFDTIEIYLLAGPVVAITAGKQDQRPRLA